MSDSTKSTSRAIYLDSTSAQADMKKLQAEADRLKLKLDAGELSGKKLTNALTKFDEVNAKIKSVQDQLDQGLKPSLSGQITLVTKLKNELSRLSESDPRFAAKQKEFQQQSQLLDEMRTRILGVKKASEEAGSGLLNKASAAISSFAGNLAANFVSGALSMLQSAISESVTLALKAEGIRNAFARLNNPGLLDQLREATKGTVSDLELMQKAVTANNFQIPLETLGTLLQFAQRRARDTGESVDYLVDSIVTGIARKSPLILDNLGINIQRIQKEFEKTGDFAKAAMNVVNEELAKSGPSIDLMSDKVSRVGAAWDNIKTKAGGFFLTLGDGLINSYDAIFNHQDLVTRKENELLAEEFKRSQDDIVARVRSFNGNYAKADKDGRNRIVEQVKEQIRLTEFLENQAMIQGDVKLTKTLTFKLDAYRKFIKDVTVVAQNPGDTIAGIEGELQTLNQMLKTSKIGSEGFIATQKKIKELNKQLDDANGTSLAKSQKEGESASKKAAAAQKKATEENKRLFEQYNDFVRGLNASITEVLSTDASKRFIAINKQTADDLEKLKKLASGDEQYQKGKLLILEKQKAAIHALVEEEAKTYKPAPEQVSTVDPSSLPAALKNSLPKGKVKVPLEIVPEIAPEDEKAAGVALAKVVERLQRDAKAGLQFDVLNAKNPTERKDALLIQLDEEHTAEINNKELTDNEKLVKEAEYQEKRKQIVFDYQKEIVGYIQKGLEVAGQVVDIFGKFGQAATNRENAAFKNETKNNDARKKQIQHLADTHVISSQEAARRIAAIDLEQDKKKEDLEKKQFERNKKQQIAQAAINGALAVTNIWATTPKVDFGVSTYLMLGLSAIATLASIAEIASQKFATGGQVQPEDVGNGKITASSNIPTQPNGDDVLATVKVGEVILNEEQQKKLGGAATFRAIGVPGFGSGGTVKPFWKTRPYQSVNFPEITRSMQIVKFAQGGSVQPAAPKPETPAQVTDPSLVEMLRQQQQINTALINSVDNLNSQISNGIEANVSLHKLKKAQDQEKRIQKDSEFR